MEPQFSMPTLEARDRAIPPEILDRARSWHLVVDLDPSPQYPRLAGAYLRCGACDQGVKRIGQGRPEEFTAWTFPVTDLEAAVLAHVLQVHRPEVDPGWGGA